MVRSLVGRLPMIAVAVLDQETIDALPGFKKRMTWFLENRPELAKYVSYGARTKDREAMNRSGSSQSRRGNVSAAVWSASLIEEEFLSDFGIRWLSKIHEKEPFKFSHGGEYNEASYVPGESDSWMFGGNSNGGPGLVPGQ